MSIIEIQTHQIARACQNLTDLKTIFKQSARDQPPRQYLALSDYLRRLHATCLHDEDQTSPIPAAAAAPETKTPDQNKELSE